MQYSESSLNTLTALLSVAPTNFATKANLPFITEVNPTFITNRSPAFMTEPNPAFTKDVIPTFITEANPTFATDVYPPFVTEASPNFVTKRQNYINGQQIPACPGIVDSDASSTVCCVGGSLSIAGPSSCAGWPFCTGPATVTPDYNPPQTCVAVLDLMDPSYAEALAAVTSSIALYGTTYQTTIVYETDATETGGQLDPGVTQTAGVFTTASSAGTSSSGEKKTVTSSRSGSSTSSATAATTNSDSNSKNNRNAAATSQNTATEITRPIWNGFVAGVLAVIVAWL